MLASVLLSLRIAQVAISLVLLIALVIFWRDVFYWRNGRPRAQAVILALLLIGLLVSIAALVVALRR